MKALVSVLVVLLLLLQYRLWVGDGSVAEVTRLRAAVEDRQAAIAMQRERNSVLEAEVQDLRAGLDAVEERARSELGMIRRGETFFHVVDRPAATAPR